MFKVHCMNNIAQVGTDALGSGFELTDNLQEADAILVRSADLHDIELPPGLLAIARAGAGVNNIPIDLCAERGIPVFNTPGANANAVKEMVVAGLLLAARDIIGGIGWVRANADKSDVAALAEKSKSQFAGTELAGKTLGVIGLGAIGAMVANTGRSLGMRVLGYDPYVSVKYAWSLDRHVRHVKTLDEILGESDYITIHVPANEKTHHMIGADEISQMKEGVVFLNYARDSLVDETAMAQALTAGQVRHYMTDFANPLSTQMASSIVTPHLGASTQESEDNCAVMAAHELRDYLLWGTIDNAVNFGHSDMGPMAGVMRLGIFHRNKPNMIGQFTSAVSALGINIENMSDKSRGDHAYSLLDLCDSIRQDDVDKLALIEGVYRVRAIRPEL
ncbi:MAG: 3-phosphoglycerate dehydrogenase [Atopobiaceae bacterium]|nr:3-phosphoglycerate dehydrogenase [Atopobiaceae bacterium]